MKKIDNTLFLHFGYNISCPNKKIDVDAIIEKNKKIFGKINDLFHSIFPMATGFGIRNFYKRDVDPLYNLTPAEQWYLFRKNVRTTPVQKEKSKTKLTPILIEGASMCQGKPRAKKSQKKDRPQKGTLK